MSRLTGAWTAGSAGGCPKYQSWSTNPQFHLQPTVDGATYALELQQSAHPYHPIGFWVMTASDAASRKTTLVKSEMVTKTKYKAADRVSHSVQLPRRPDGLPYIVVVSTFDPELLNSFTLSVASAEDPAVRLVPVMDASVPAAVAAVPTAAAAPPPPAAAALAPIGRPAAARVGAAGGGAVGTAAAAAGTDASMTSTSLAGSRRSTVTQAPPQAAPPASQPVVAVAAPSADEKPVDNEPVLTQEGQGLSERQRADAAAMVQAALDQCARTGRPFEDPDFCGGAALGDGAWPHAALVAQWRRPAEIAASAGSAEAARLFKSDWEIEGVVLGPCANNWAMAAFNIVAGDPDVIGRVFVDREHAAQVCASYAHAPPHLPISSDDDVCPSLTFLDGVFASPRLACSVSGVPPPLPRRAGLLRVPLLARRPAQRRRLARRAGRRPAPLCAPPPPLPTHRATHSADTGRPARRAQLRRPASLSTNTNTPNTTRLRRAPPDPVLRRRPPPPLCTGGADGLPCFSRNPSPYVFWAAIVEKAVAKLFGSYQVIIPPSPSPSLHSLSLLSPLLSPLLCPLSSLISHLCSLLCSAHSSYQHTEAPISAGMHLRGLELATGGSGKEGIGVQVCAHACHTPHAPRHPPRNNPTLSKRAQPRVPRNPAFVP